VCSAWRIEKSLLYSGLELQSLGSHYTGQTYENAGIVSEEHRQCGEIFNFGALPFVEELATW
jgi:hypothetical protein